MSQSAPPPQPQPGPVDANPYAQQAPAGAPYPPQPGVPGAAPMAPPAGPAAPAAPAPVRDNLVVGLVAAAVAAVVAAALYGAVIGATKHEIGYAAVGVGFVIGLAAGKAGGRNPVLPVASVVLALVAVYFGQLVGEAMIGAKETGLGFSQVFFDHFDVVQRAWKEDADLLTFVFFAIAGFASFSAAKKSAL
ncbi:hypothetical protein SAMN04490357_4769 [Streptomyces misionensis]|uniref:Uncharacterized protein n=1 Tax=Streptomyces misionensis TaxID=67331 RepID=A0A1H5AJI8_9ACTN|nr:hypothetical protein [Streptomyces misionensis]SED42402.1 hypothetical protein SAMN04490357_4769 [Streptomyces misionensis]